MRKSFTTAINAVKKIIPNTSRSFSSLQKDEKQKLPYIEEDCVDHVGRPSDPKPNYPKDKPLFYLHPGLHDEWNSKMKANPSIEPSSSEPLKNNPQQTTK
ncbi:MAG: hypothetical protein EBS06_06275 [Proteobacteria bacterium]|nr:hypothetical protein [Pseudomonadota bacterium]